MEFRILGPFEVRSTSRLIDLGGQKQRALLALLLLEANRPVTRDRLIDALWEDEPTATAQKALQVYVSQLRKLLGKDRLLTQAHGYLLRVEPDELDLARFKRLRAEGKLHDALAMWRGPPLADFAQQRFAQSEIARLEELRLTCLEERLDADLAEARHAELVGELEALVQDYPLRERLRELLLLALYRSGRQAEALAAYQDARAALVDELGIEPGKRLRELQQAILRQDPALDVASALDSARGIFVGRDAELAVLLAGLDDVLAGHGRLFLLVGEPGIGKSRLAEELIRRARARSVHVLVGRCWEASAAPAYWPWVQSLRSYVREAEPEALRHQLGAGAPELAQILPELRTILPGLAKPSSPESEAARFRLFDATVEFLRNASRDRPLLLFLDDLHAADAPSLLLLEFLARELGSTRLLVLGACRDVDPTPGHSLASMLAAVAREPVTTRLLLRGLSERDVAEYVQLAAGEFASSELIAALHEETEGNPLFVGETVRLLALEGRISIPESVKDVISRRLAHLDNECKRVLVLASVLGREFALDDLARLSAVDEGELLDTLDEAMAARVLSDVPGVPTHVRFAHVLIRDTLYEGLTTARRVRLHRQTAEALEALHGDDQGLHLAELAHHSMAGNDLDKALRYAELGGDQALALHAYEEAARLFALGLEAHDLGGGEPGKRCDLLLALGHAQVRAGDGPDAKETFFQAAAVARRLERPDALGRAALGYGGRFVWARAAGDDRLVALLQEALAADGHDAALRARLLARLATALRDQPEIEPRALLSNEAVELARGLGDPATLAYTLVGRYAAVWSPGHADERLAISTELIDLAASTGDKEREVEGRGFRFHALLELGEVAAADADFAARGRLTKEMRQPAQLAIHLWLDSIRNLLVGAFAAAEETIHQAFELAQRAQGDEARGAFELQRFVLRREQGRVAEIESALEAWADAHPARPIFRCAAANLCAELDRDDEARRRVAGLTADDFPPDGEWLCAIALLADTCGRLDDRASAPHLYRLLLPFAGLNVAGAAEVSIGAVSRYLGALASAMTEFDASERHFEDALGLNARMGARPWLAHTQHDYARMLLARGGPGDRERAQQLLDQALATFQELSMPSYATRAAALAG